MADPRHLYLHVPFCAHRCGYCDFVTVVGRSGTARYEGHHARWCWQLRPEEPWQEEVAVGLERDDLFVAQAHRFLDAVEGRGEPTCTLEEGLHTLRCNLAALASVDRGTWERIETMQGDG